MSSKRETVTKAQIALVHVAAHQLGMGDDEYRAMLHGAAGVRSARDLDAAGFEAVIQRFAALGFAGGKARPATTPAPAPYGERWGMATPAQVETIRGMWRAWFSGSEEASGGALRHWLERRYQVTDLRFCDLATAQKAITGLRAMNAHKARQAKARAGRSTAPTATATANTKEPGHD